MHKLFFYNKLIIKQEFVQYIGQLLGSLFIILKVPV